MENFKNKITNVNLVENKGNKKIFEANMKIYFKKIKNLNENERIFYKNELVSNDKDSKIYDIVEDNKNNMLCIAYDQSLNIDKILNKGNGEEKEAVVKGHCDPISKSEIFNLFKKEDSMCKINFEKEINGVLENLSGSGFFCKINNKEIPFNKCLFTNNHVLDQDAIQINKEIKLLYKNKDKKITITKNRRAFTDKELD